MKAPLVLREEVLLHVGLEPGNRAMPRLRQGGSGNAILDLLPEAALDEIAPHLEAVDLTQKQTLVVEGQVPDYVHFPCGGILSYTVTLPMTGPAEFGIVGREGLSSFTAMWSQRPSAVTTVVQIGGSRAFRMEAEAFRQAMRGNESLRDAVQRFLYEFMAQMAFTAVSNVRHPLPARLARWLLMCNDRLDGDEVHLTHDFMAMMIGAQRSSVTTTLHVLEGEGAVRSQRGVVTVMDRSRLERCAGEAYSAQYLRG